MNRAEMRRRAREINTPYKLEMLERQLRATIKKEYEEMADRRIEKFIQGYTTFVIYVLWHCFGMGKKRIARFRDEVDKHLDVLGDEKRYGLTLKDMTTMLKEEADIDLKFLDDEKKD
jgi:hypothetical protein